MKIEYHCSNCDQKFDNKQECMHHEMLCMATIPDWVTQGNYVGSHIDGEVWRIVSVSTSSAMVLLEQCPPGLGGDHALRKHMRASAVVSYYEPVEVIKHDKDSIAAQTGNHVYIPGEYVIDGLAPNGTDVHLRGVADHEVGISVPLKLLHRIAVHSGSEVPVARIMLHDEDEEYDFLELVDSCKFEL